MSRLTDKYQSYPHYKGISFDESSYTLTPTRTGAKQISGNSITMSDSNFALVGNNPTIETGVLPNQKCYGILFDDSVSPNINSRLIYGSTSSSNTGTTTDIRRMFWDWTPFDRVMGIWVKTPETAPPQDAPAPLAAVRLFTNGSSAMVFIGVGKSPDGNPCINITHSGAELSSGGASISYYESYTDQNSNTVSIEYNKWYFVAIKKSVNETTSGIIGNVQNGTLEYKHYINGELVNTVTRTAWTKRSINAIVFGNSNSFITGKIAISSWFMAEWSDIGQTQLREIYKYGAPIQAPVKYFDGTTWQDDMSAPKIFHSNQWNDVYANKYDGSQWVPI
jgi:hypothetical protein